MQKTLNQLRMLIQMSLSNVDTDIKIQDKYTFRTWWEEREEITTFNDPFVIREDGVEYWKTISLMYDGDEICNYSPCDDDIADNYNNMVREFHLSIYNN